MGLELGLMLWVGGRGINVSWEQSSTGTCPRGPGQACIVCGFHPCKKLIYLHFFWFTIREWLPRTSHF